MYPSLKKWVNKQFGFSKFLSGTLSWVVNSCVEAKTPVILVTK